MTESFADHLPHPVFRFSREGELVYSNPAAEELAGSLGISDVAQLLPDETEAVVRNSLAADQPRANLESRRGNRSFSWLFIPVPEEGVVHCVVTETTKQCAMESQLRHSQKLEAVGRLASGVAHDFNNILTVIQGHVGLLKSGPGLNPSMIESLEQIAQSTERARQLTGQLLTFSRKTSMHAAAVDLNRVLTDFSRMLHRTLGEDIEYQFSYAPDLPPITADVRMLEQVVMIMAVNARDAMPRGGQLLISTSTVQVGEDDMSRHPEARPGQFVCLSLVDSGTGMDDVTQGRLFEPFFTTKEFGKGSGLGLAVAYGIINQHQGWIEVESVVGQGSTFKVFLPVASGVEETSAPAPAAVRGGTETIMVVEDEPPVRWVLRNVLERYGYQVFEASSGVEALAVWHQHHEEIELVVVDIVMPVGLTGKEMVEQFTSQKPDLKVIYTSGYTAHAASEELGLTEGLNFLHKPFDAETLARTVRQVLDGGGGLS